jgi:hypothetical protein
MGEECFERLVAAMCRCVGKESLMILRAVCAWKLRRPKRWPGGQRSTYLGPGFAESPVDGEDRDLRIR